MDASVGFREFLSHLRLAGSHDRPTGQLCVGPTRFCMCLPAAVCGDRTVEAYSNCGQMRALYAVEFSSVLIHEFSVHNIQWDCRVH